jgi:hypothetical protein
VAGRGPDLLLITGDFINDKNDHRAAMPILKRLLPRLKARLGVFGILGNHDVDIVVPVMAEWGVTLIDGRRAVLEASGGADRVGGAAGVGPAGYGCALYGGDSGEAGGDVRGGDESLSGSLQADAAARGGYFPGGAYAWGADLSAGGEAADYA